MVAIGHERIEFQHYGNVFPNLGVKPQNGLLVVETSEGSGPRAPTLGEGKGQGSADIQTLELIEVLELEKTTDVYDLVVFNDDINTFEHVIRTLVKVCKHSFEQAEQCTLLIHYRGKCAVKIGSFEELTPLRQAICDAGIDARII